MKILFVSMNSIHFQRWTDQLRDSGHDIYWFDILDQGYASSMPWITQITGWKKGFLRRKGRTLTKKKLPKLYRWLERKYDVSVSVAFEKTLLETQPDLVQSFALYVAAAPIKEVMFKYAHINWAYSAWGSDLFYFQNQPDYLNDIKQVLERLDFLFTDCKRDYQIAKEYGFKGKFLGVFPGGGGFDLDALASYRLPVKQRRVIAVKGYQNRSGRAVHVLQALELFKETLEDYEVVVFGADNEEVFRFRESEIPNITIHGKLTHDEVLQIFGKSLLYIGNSNSDGIPNTFLEAICSGAYPIQSNPGNATAELIIDETNGRLIEHCEDSLHIAQIIKEVLSKPEDIEQAITYNYKYLVPSLQRNSVIENVKAAYDSIL